MLHVAISGRKLQWFQKFPAIVEKSRTELYFGQKLQGQKSCEMSCKESMLHVTTCLQLVSLSHCDTSCKKIASYNTSSKKPFLVFSQNLLLIHHKILKLWPFKICSANASKLIEKFFLNLRNMFSNQENIRIFFSKQEKQTHREKFSCPFCKKV